MEFTRLNYDTCTYQHNLRQSVGMADYQLSTPSQQCTNCFSTDNILGKYSGDSLCQDKPQVDVESELWLISRQATNCPTGKYLPSQQPFCKTTSIKDCQGIRNEATRISNPPCTLRSTGWNRFEWLCMQPQDKALIPFDFNINSTLIVKDNFRPCLPNPIDFSKSLPPLNNSDDIVQYKQECKSYGPEVLPGTHFRKCGEYKF